MANIGSGQVAVTLRSAKVPVGTPRMLTQAELKELRRSKSAAAKHTMRVVNPTGLIKPNAAK